MPPFILSRYTAKKTARFVSEIGTGLNGRGMDNGPRMQNTAVISPARVRRLILVPVFCCGISVGFIMRSLLFQLDFTYRVMGMSCSEYKPGMGNCQLENYISLQLRLILQDDMLA